MTTLDQARCLSLENRKAIAMAAPRASSARLAGSETRRRRRHWGIRTVAFAFLCQPRTQQMR